MTIQRILLRFPPEKKNILPAIKAVNKDFGWVSEEAIGTIARYFNLSEAHIFSVASFYDEIKMKKPTLVEVEICDGANCQTKSADQIIRKIEIAFKVKTGDSNRHFSLRRMSCMGRCLEGPIVKIDNDIYIKMTAEKTIQIIQDKLNF